MIPDIPPPPGWLADWSRTFLTDAAIPLYVLLAVTSFAVWAVLRWQRRPDETAPARSFRAYCLSKGALWLVLAVTRWVAPLWRLPLYDLVTVWILLTTLWVLASLVWVYVLPAIRGDPPPASPLEAVVPEPKAWSGEERRSGKERRKNPPQSFA